MARPAEPEKKADLAREAIDVFARLGFDVPMSKLADELGVKRPTLLYHFPSRAHVVEAALFELLVEQAKYVMSKVEAHEHPIDRLDAQIRAVHAFHHGKEQRITLLSQAVVSNAAQMSNIIDIGNKVFEAQRQAAAERVRKGVEQGVVHPCDADALICLVRAVIDGLMVQRVMTGVALAPIHEFFWTNVLLPLKREPSSPKRPHRTEPAA
ncbi:MAG: TetR family transcriptional regulator [Polyangiaceae bacterium]